MQKEVLKLICASQGALDADFLVCNLGSSVAEIISSSDKLVSCCPFGQEKVVARTCVQLCQSPGCPGSCRRLHLCRRFLLSGSCQPMPTSAGCSFSHELNSEHNRRILNKHELAELSRKELCTLLMQSDSQILPPVCHDYNNGPGVFGRCQAGHGCRRVHVCETFLNRDCRCSRNHNFRAPQPRKALQGIPEDLLHSLRSTYANIQAVKYCEERLRSEGAVETTQRPPAAAGLLNPEEACDARGDGSQRRKRRRGGRGRAGKSSHPEGAFSLEDLRTGFSVLELVGLGGNEAGMDQKSRRSQRRGGKSGSHTS